jgi:hypothetical protein
MATYAELLSASEDPGLKNKVRVALTIAAEAIRTEGAVANHAARLALAKAISLAPAPYVDPMLRAVLAQNAAATLATILAASDATVQTAVNAAIDVFV